MGLVDACAVAVVATLAAVLAVASASKLRSRSGRAGVRPRAQALAELLIAGVAAAAPPAPGGAVLAIVFAGFAATHAWRLWSSTAQDCECFGDDVGEGRGVRRLVVTAVSACLAAVAAVTGAQGVASVVAARPGRGLALLVGAVVAAHLWRRAFTGPVRPATGASEWLVTSSARLLERRFSRRGLLVRIAVAGSALSVAPLRYLLYPGTALAAISPGACADGACTDGYTAFCCQINDGMNSCPEGTFPGGWWMCTDYAGRRLCADRGVRYYVDCNALPGREYRGGCRCANGSCDNQRVACNVFRYGQCNPHIGGVSAVVCRMVVCESPSSIPQLNCGASVAVDDAVCDQDTPCLEPRATELAGAGGV
jgi:hypothetical protein